MKMLGAIRSGIRLPLRRLVGLGRTGRAAFSQEGEDLVIARFLALEQDPTPGIYVDVGAHHPERYSNTLYFYCRGWRGINIDPLPGMYTLFQRVRPRDISLEIAISDQPGDLEYIVYEESALNGCDSELALRRNATGAHRIQERRRVAARTLESVLAEHLPENPTIDFLTVDVEGHDLAVLRSNDWNRFRPLLVATEDASIECLADVTASETSRFLDGVGYVAVAKTALTLVFAAREALCQTELGVRVRRRNG